MMPGSGSASISVTAQCPLMSTCLGKSKGSGSFDYGLITGQFAAAKADCVINPIGMTEKHAKTKKPDPFDFSGT